MGCCCNQTEETGEDRVDELGRTIVGTPDERAEGDGREMTHDAIAVDGMTCGGCEDAVQRAVGSLAGVHHVDADHGAARVTVRFDPEAVAPAVIRETISGAGYRVAT